MNGVYKMKSLEELETLLKVKCNFDERIITGIWTTDCLYNPPMNGRIFTGFSSPQILDGTFQQINHIILII